MSNGLSGCMCERERCVLGAQLLRKLGSYPVEDQGGTPAGLSLNFNIAPADTVIPSRSQSFHASFLRGKTGREPFDVVGFGLAITDFSLGEDALQKAIAKALDGGRQAWYFDNVNPGAHDHAGKITQSLGSQQARDSEQLFGFVNKIVAHRPRLGREFMRFSRPAAVYMKYLMPAGDQKI